MQKKLTITVDEQVYAGLHQVIGRHKISRFIESLVRPHVVSRDLIAAYREMAADEARGAEAHEWAEATIADAAHETRGGLVEQVLARGRQRGPTTAPRRHRQ